MSASETTPAKPADGGAREDTRDEVDVDAFPDDADMAEDAPLLTIDRTASNDEWVYRRADRLEARAPARRRRNTDQSTEAGVFDQPTMLILHRLLIHGVLRSVDFTIATGKEANVFRATTPEGAFLAVKIYRVNTASFHNLLQYIHGDERFAGVSGDRRQLVKAWCQKEMRNLHRLRSVGVGVPEPVKAMGNVLLMQYLGTSEGPWPQLREAAMADPQAVYRRLVDDVVRSHNEAGLVHADLSEYNVLLENAGQGAALETPRIIDVGQAVLVSHPMAREFLERDVKNLVRFFARHGVEAAPDDVMARLRRPDLSRLMEDDA